MHYSRRFSFHGRVVRPATKLTGGHPDFEWIIEAVRMCQRWDLLRSFRTCGSKSIGGFALAMNSGCVEYGYLDIDSNHRGIG